MSGVIVIGIVAIWILVLVPMWLNRHDADNASRSMDTFSTAMRVLSRRTPARPDRRFVVMPRRDSWGLTVDNQPDVTGRRLPGVFRKRGAGLTTGRARLLARRRRIALLFAALTIGFAVSAVVAGTSWWLELAADLGLAGYIVHLRNEAIRSAEMRRRRLARAAREAGAWAPSEVPASRRESPLGRRDRVDAGLGAGFGAAAGVASGAVAASASVSASASGTENGSRWEPVPVPLPTYVSKPVVARPAAAAPKADVESGTIDLTRPGAWIDSQVDVRHLLLDETGSGTISASAGAAGASRSRAVVDVQDDELDIILERRRAVGD
jgi:hypothetical protein